VWPKDGTIIKLPSLGDIPNLDTSATAEPWFIVYANKRGGISACTWVIDDPDNGIYAFYNACLVELYEGELPVEKVFLNIEGVGFSPYHNKVADLWEDLTEGVSPSYETLSNIGEFNIHSSWQNPKKLLNMVLYKASHFIPNSINKLHIGG
jgi:hypothetical protein